MKPSRYVSVAKYLESGLLEKDDRKWAALFLFLALLALSPIHLVAQTETATISGQVTDTSQSPVPNAPVSIRNEQTAQSFSVKSGEDGAYVSPPLRPGAYTVSVEIQGFKKAIQSATLDIDQRARLDFHMELGSVSESVTVEAGAQLLETQSAALGNVRTPAAINDLPLNGRNFVQLFQIAAGVGPLGSGPTLNSSASNQTGVMGGAVNGARPSNNDFRYDGIQSQDTDQNVLIFQPNPDAIQEFKVQTSAMDASFGRNGGATINLILKSGTNALHGTLFEFLRNSALDAKNYFDSPTTKIPPFRLNQFGGTLGGPIRRDRTFFFMDYQGTRNRQAQTFVSTVPTAAFKQGNFAALPFALYDPATTRVLAGSTIRDPFAGNQIPSARFNNAGRNLMNLYPDPNLPGISNNYLFNPSRALNVDQYDVRVDHRFGDKDLFFARFSQSLLSAYNPSFLPAPALGAGPTYPGNNTTAAEQAVLTETHTISPTLVYEFRAGFSRLNIRNVSELQGSNIAERVGIPGVNVNPDLSAIGPITVSGFQGLGQTGTVPTTKINNNFQYTNRLTWSRGNQTWKFGYELLRRQMNQYSPTAPMGQWSFTGQFTQNPFSASGTGSGGADLLLGLDASARLDIEYPAGLRRWEHSFFANDDIRVTNKFTLNLGLRYELTTPWTEIHNRLGSLVPSLGDVFQVGTPELPGDTVTATNYRDFAPRVGIAYQLTPKTVIRTGYGLFYSFPGVASSQLPTKTPPVAGNYSVTNNTTATNLNTVVPISAGFPTARPTTFDPTGSAFKFYPYNDPDASIHQWNFNVQQELGAQTVLTVAYAGSRGNHLYVFPNFNQPVPGPGAANLRRPYPNLSDGSGFERAADSYFHSLQITGEKRLSQGLSVLANYTWSHSIDTSSLDTGGGPQDALNLRADRGNSEFDIRHRAVLSWTYQIPYGRGQKFGNSNRGVKEYVLGNWQINSIDTFMTGSPFTLTSAQNTLGAGAGTQRANRIVDGTLPSDQRSVQRWFDTSAFTTPGLYQYGNAARNALYGPSTRQIDFSVFKQFPLWKESQKLEFRSEFFNIFNTPQFNNPNSSIGSTAAGTITSAGDKVFFQRTSRQIQFAMKLYF